jgi:adenylylsulfate kinase
MIILLMGQPASGKTTLAKELIRIKDEERKFFQEPQYINVDGDKWREITKNTDYSKEGRLRNLKGAFDMALYMETLGFIPVISMVTPYQELREYLKSNSQKLIQVFLEYNEDRGRNEKFALDFQKPKEDILSLNTSQLSISDCIELINNQIK